MDNNPSNNSNEIALQLINLAGKVVVELGPHLLSALQEIIKTNNQIENSLSNLNKKADQLIVREIQSSLQLINGLTTVDSARMREKYLDTAEENLLKNIALDESLIVGGETGAYWSGQAFFGLSFVATLRNENIDATRYLLKCFIKCPNKARTTWATEFYQKHFEPHCQDIFKNYKSEVGNMDWYDKKRNEVNWEIRINRLKQVGIGTITLADKFFNKYHRPYSVSMSQRQITDINQEIRSLEAQYKGIPTKESLEKELNERLDAKCREMAENLLNNKS